MIVITEFMDEAAVDTLRADHSVHFDPRLADNQADIPALLTNARALIVRNRTQVTEDLLAAAPQLEIVARLGVGLDNIDLEACAKQEVEVAPATDANARSVAEYVISTALVLLRTAYFSRESMMSGEWPRGRLQGRELSDRTLGLIGFGTIAQMTAKFANAFNVRVIASDPYLPEQNDAWSAAERVDLETLFESSDVVSVHVPLTSGTRHLVSARRLALMKPGSVLINTSRGGVVDETALAAALSSGILGGAALDVFEEEPLSAEGAAKFQNLDNVILTPHIAGVTRDSNILVSRVTAENVLRKLGIAAQEP